MYSQKAVFNKIYSSYKNNAKYKGRIFEIDREIFEMIILQKCYYCGCEPEISNYDKYKNIKTNGIDRKDNNLGYTINNCVTCCKRCNYLKKDMSHDDFLDLINKIYNNIK